VSREACGRQAEGADRLSEAGVARHEHGALAVDLERGGEMNGVVAAQAEVVSKAAGSPESAPWPALVPPPRVE
jgi:hypothetical protein